VLFFINIFCVTQRKLCDVEENVNNVLFSATSLHPLSRNHKTISLKTGLVENFLGGTAGNLVAVRFKQGNVGLPFGMLS
jgi:hypothetical protein